MRRAAAVLGVALTSVALAACGGQGGSGAGSAPLATLRADGLARFVPRQGALAHERAQGQHTALGKPVAAQLRRDFNLGSDAVPGAVIEQVLREATADGWRQEGSRTRDSVTLRKQTGTGPATATVVLPRQGDALPESVRLPALTIDLTHGFS